MSDLANRVSVFEDRTQQSSEKLHSMKWKKVQENIDMITKIIDDIFATEDSGTLVATDLEGHAMGPKMTCFTTFVPWCLMTGLMLLSFVLKMLHDVRADGCGNDRECLSLETIEILGSPPYIWTLWIFSSFVIHTFFSTASQLLADTYSRSVTKNSDSLFVILTSRESIALLLMRASWLGFFYLIVDTHKYDHLIKYAYYAGGCLLIYNTLHVMRGVLLAYLELSLQVSSQTLRMKESMVREQILYYLTNYYLYEDQCIEVPSFREAHHIHASVLQYVSAMKNISDQLSSSNTGSLARDVIGKIEELQTKLTILLQESIPRKLRRSQTPFVQEDFDRWLHDIQISAAGPSAAIIVDSAVRVKSVVDLWKSKMRRHVKLHEARETVLDGSRSSESSVQIAMSKYRMNELHDDMMIPVNKLHFSEMYSDRAWLRHYSGQAFTTVEEGNRSRELEAKKLGFFIFWNIKRDKNSIQVAEQDLDALLTANEFPLDVAKVWDMIDLDNTCAVDLSECVRFVDDTFILRRDLARTITDSKSILKQLRLVMGLLINFTMIFVVLEVFKIARFVSMWQAFSASLIAFSFVFGNSLRQAWDNLVFLFSVHAFDVGDIIKLDDTRYTVNTISLSHVGCTRPDGAAFTIPMQSFVGRDLQNITRSGSKWETFSMLVDIETTKEQLADVAADLKEHISCNKRHYGGMYRIFFVPTDGLIHKLKLAIYYNHSRNGSDLMDIGHGRTLFYDAAAKAMRRVGIKFTLPDFSNERKSKSQAREMDHMDYQNYTVYEDRVFDIGTAESDASQRQ